MRKTRPFCLLIALFILSACSKPAEFSNTPALESPRVVETQSGDLENEKHILFFGDSMTAGYGVNPEDAFPALIQNRIDSLGLSYRVSNGGLSGDTSSGGLRRIDWMLRDSIDIFIYELGGNDGLRGVDLNLTYENSDQILFKVKEKYPKAKLVVAGMMLPPNLGAEYTEEFRTIFPTLAKTYEATLIPFILEGVGGVKELNQPDGIHPTEEGHKIISNTVWQYLEPLLDKAKTN